MRLMTLCALAIAAVAIGCKGSSNSGPSSTVVFLAIDPTNTAASVKLQALVAATPTQIAASRTVRTSQASEVGRKFDGELVVAPGEYVFKAISYDASGAEIGDGEAEDGRPIATTDGGTTSVSITMLPHQQGVSGPVITSFVVTPTGTTVRPNTPVSLVATVAYDGSEALHYAWTQDCANGVFSTPTDGLEATWSDPAEETCNLTFVVTEPGSGHSDSRTIGIICSCIGTGATGQALVTCEHAGWSR